MLYIEHVASESHLQQLGSVTAEVEFRGAQKERKDLHMVMYDCHCVLEEDPVESREVRPDFPATGLAVIGIERPETVCQKRINIYQRHLLTVLSLEPSIPRSMVNSSKPWSKPIRTTMSVK